MTRRLPGSALAGLLLPALLAACTGPPPLHLRLEPLGGPPVAGEPLRVRVLPAEIADPQDPFGQVAGDPVPERGERLVRLDGTAMAGEGAAFTLTPLGATPSMLLQWGGFDGARPQDPARRLGYRLEVHEGPVGLPEPPGWRGPPWDPSQERWYAEAGVLESDAQVARFLHRNMGGRFGEEPEPWIQLDFDAEGRPRRLYLWVVLGAAFEDPGSLFLRLQPGDPRCLRAHWSWGDGEADAQLAGEAGDPLEERVEAEHVYTEPGRYTLRADLELGWLYGAWARGGEPWVWTAEVHELGWVDLSPLADSWGPGEIEALRADVAAIRSRLRCLPGDQGAPVFEEGAPCSYQPASQPDAFMDPGPGGAVPALLRQLLPDRLAEDATSLPRGGEPRMHALRYAFSGVFPHASAPEGSDPARVAAWGSSAELEVQVQSP